MKNLETILGMAADIVQIAGAPLLAKALFCRQKPPQPKTKRKRPRTQSYKAFCRTALRMLTDGSGANIAYVPAEAIHHAARAVRDQIFRWDPYAGNRHSLMLPG